MNNYNREKNKRRKINSSGGNSLGKNKFNKNNINEIDYFLVKARTPNFGAKNINYMNINNQKDKNRIKKLYNNFMNRNNICSNALSLTNSARHSHFVPDIKKNKSKYKFLIFNFYIIRCRFNRICE